MTDYNSKSLKELRSNVRGQLIGKYSICIFVTITLAIISLLVTSLTDKVYSGTVGNYILYLFVTIIVDLLSGVLFFGQSRFFLNLVRGIQPLSPGEMFYGFRNSTDKAILIQAVFTLVSLLGSIPALLVNFGVLVITPEFSKTFLIVLPIADLLLAFVAKIFVGQSFYILNDHPEYSVKEVLSESLRLMKHRKGKFVLVYITSLPLLLVSILAFGFGALWFGAYFQTLLANFYLDLIGEEPGSPVKEPEPSDSNVSPDFF